ncbi:hypothetical protein N7454_000403 [Penicillium verhagenii]|nr:hypothetical protein N7454_000403 [Penicillium verhagenii]
MQSPYCLDVFRWIPAHAGVPGNELANTAAKAALESWREAGPEEPFPRFTLVAKQQVRQKIKEIEYGEWERKQDVGFTVGFYVESGNLRIYHLYGQSATFAWTVELPEYGHSMLQRKKRLHYHGND